MSYLWQNGVKYDSKEEHFRVLYKLIIILGTPLKSGMWDVHSCALLWVLSTFIQLEYCCLTLS